MSHADPPWSMQRCMHESMVTVRSNEYWIASTRAPCFSCARFATVLGLLFPASSAICRGGDGSPLPLPASDEIRYFQLVYVQQISAPTLADIVQLHADDDPLLGCRYVMNHCGGCGARFSDSKLFESREGLFNPGRARRIEFRRCVGPIVATGRVSPIANSIAISLDDLVARAAEAEPAMTGGAPHHAGGGGEEDRSAGLVGALRAFARLFGPLWRHPVGLVARADSPAFRKRPCDGR
jgi:hypothetical protein